MEYTVYPKTWRRYAYFRHFCDEAPCAITMQGSIDVSALRAAVADRFPFTAAMLYCVSYIANGREEFRMTATRAGEPAVWDTVHPSYTVFHADDETCTAVCTLWEADFPTFAARFQEDAARASATRIRAAAMPPNIFSATPLPFYAYDAVHLQYGPGVEIPLSPSVVWGRWREADGRYILPVTLSIHHAAADGFHVCRFFRELQTVVNGLPGRI